MASGRKIIQLKLHSNFVALSFHTLSSLTPGESEAPGLKDWEAEDDVSEVLRASTTQSVKPMTV